MQPYDDDDVVFRALVNPARELAAALCIRPYLPRASLKSCARYNVYRRIGAETIWRQCGGAGKVHAGPLLEFRGINGARESEICRVMLRIWARSWVYIGMFCIWDGSRVLMDDCSFSRRSGEGGRGVIYVNDVYVRVFFYLFI